MQILHNSSKNQVLFTEKNPPPVSSGPKPGLEAPHRPGPMSAPVLFFLAGVLIIDTKIIFFSLKIDEDVHIFQTRRQGQGWFYFILTATGISGL